MCETNTHTPTSRWLSEKTQQRQTKSLTEPSLWLQPPDSGTSKVQCFRHIPISERGGGGGGVGGRDGRGRMTCRNTAQQHVPLSVGQPTQREECTTKERAEEAGTLHPVSCCEPISFALRAWPENCLLQSNHIRSVQGSYACKQASEAARRFGGAADSAGGASRRKRAGLVTSPSFSACFLRWQRA